MATLGLDNLVHQALNLEVLTSPQVQEIWTTLGTQNVSADEFLNEAVRKGFLTSYQVERLKRGDTTGFYFGDYKVLYHIGSGTFARVYRATHKHSGKIVALKILRANFNDNAEVINHFVHEAELGIELRHPNIVPIYEVQSRPGEHFMVMDFIEGQTLREFLRVRGKIEPKVATKILTDICSGLDYAARRQLQHRDLKLSNVLLSTMGRAMLVDFGLATIAENSSFGNAEVRNQRSIDYAALERITGVKRDDNRSDIYFLGCIYYHLLTGEPPLLETKDRAKRLNRNRFISVKPIQNVDPLIPRAVTLVVNKAMSLDVEKRYQTMAELGIDLEVCARRLTDGTANDGIMLTQIDSGLARISTAASKERQKSIMIVDSDVKIQEVFRESLKKTGYRVLVASSADRAVDRLFDDISVANLVIFNVQSLGQSGVEGWTRLANDSYSSKLPSIMLLDERQTELLADVETTDIHIVLTMPIRMKNLKAHITRLLQAGEAPISSESPFTPKFELTPNLLETLDLLPDSEPAEHTAVEAAAVETVSAIDEEDEEDIDEPSDVSTHQSFGYKEILAEARQEQESEQDSFADALFDAHVPQLVQLRPEDSDPNLQELQEQQEEIQEQVEAEPPSQTQEQAEQEPFETEPQPELQEQVEFEPPLETQEQAESQLETQDHTEFELHPEIQEQMEMEVEPQRETPEQTESQPPLEPQPTLETAQSLEEIQAILDSAKVRLEEAIRGENETIGKLGDIANRKKETQESFQSAQELLSAKQLQVESTQKVLAELLAAAETLAVTETETLQLIKETVKSKEELASQHSAAKETLEKTDAEIQKRQNDHRQLDEQVQTVLSLAENEDGLNQQLEELQNLLKETEANIERMQNDSNDALSAASEARLNTTQLLEKIEALTAEHDESTGHAQSTKEEVDAATTIVEELKSNSKTLQQKADEALQSAVEKETLAIELEEEAKKALERAEQARKEANEAMAAAEESQIQAETAAEEFHAAEQFAKETTEKLQQVDAELVEHQNTLQSLREEYDRINHEAEQYEEKAINFAVELERIIEERDATQHILEETQTSHQSALSNKENLSQLQESLVKLAAELEQLQQSTQTTQEDLDRLALKSQESENFEAELRSQIEKLHEEAEKTKSQTDEATGLVEQAQEELEEVLQQQRHAEEQLQSFVEQELELNRLSEEDSANRESAQRAVEDAEKALIAFQEALEREAQEKAAMQEKEAEEAAAQEESAAEQPSEPQVAQEESAAQPSELQVAQEESAAAQPSELQVETSKKSSVSDLVAAKIRARVEAALAARKNS